MSNLRPAPLALTPAIVAKIVGDRPAYGKGITHIPLEGVLVGRPDPSSYPDALAAELEEIIERLRSTGGAAWPEHRMRALELSHTLATPEISNGR